MWIAYIDFAISNEKSNEDIGRLFERAVDTCGMEFRSDKLWDKYIDWEVKNKNYCNITQIYKRLVTTPTKCHSTHFDNVKEHIDKREPWDIVTQQELAELWVRADILIDGKKKEAAKDLPPGTTVPSSEDTESTEATLQSPSKMSDEKKSVIREALTAEFTSLYEQNEKQVQRRAGYEELIRRPYFHTKPLDGAQLRNWRTYLDFEAADGDEIRTIFLYERCMIACAQYEEFWLKYTSYLEGLGRHDDVRNVFMRACRQHLPYKASIHITWSFCEERRGNYDEALSVINNIEKQAPDNMCVMNHKLNLLRRHGDDLETLFTQYINNNKLSGESVRLLMSKYARYLSKIKGEDDKAAQVLRDSIEKHASHEQFYTQLLDVEYQRKPLDEQKVLDVFDLISNSTSLPSHVKNKFYSRRYEFIDDLGSDVNKLYTVYQQHEEAAAAALKDRKRQNTSPEKTTTEKRQKTTTHPPQHANNSYNSAAGYNSYNSGGGAYHPQSHYYSGDWNSYYQQAGAADYSGGYGAYGQYPNQGYGTGYTGYDYSGYY